jgi:hypothetical protein
MRTIVPGKLDNARIRTGHYATTTFDGFRGAFTFTIGNQRLVILSSGVDNEFGWEHVSVSIAAFETGFISVSEVGQRCPTWDEMCMVKDLFWRDEEAVMQLHPPKSDYVNYHPYVLHLWRPINATIPLPPSELVGPKS